MKIRIACFAIVLAVVSVASGFNRTVISDVVSGFSRTLAAAQSGNDLFQQALSKERAEGKLDEAIQLYARVVKEFGGDRTLAARALVQMGQCYERLGKEEARKAYERVIDEFGDQRAIVSDARARLAAFDRARAPASRGPAARRVWAGNDVELSGAPSPDGRYVSYVDWETGDLAVRDLATGTRRRLTGNPTFMRAGGFAQESAFSPDGKEIAYIWFDDQGMDLRVVRVGGGAPRILCRDPNRAMLHVSWAGDGRQIAVNYSGPDRTNQLAIVSVATGAVRALKTLDWRTPARIALSPDGRFLAYDFPPKEDSPNRDIYLLALDGSREAVLAEHAANDVFPVWTSAGTSLVFVSDRTGTPGLWAVAVENGRPQGAPRLIQPIGSVRPMGFSQSGAFFYGGGTSTIDAYIAAIDVVTGKLLDPPRPAPRHVMGVNSRPRWSWDGRYLAYQSDRVPGGGLGARRLIIQTVDTGEERDLNVPLPYFQRAEWAPDGRSLLVQGRSPKGSRGFFKIDVATGETSLAIPRPDGQGYGETWSPDGRTVFYTGSSPAGRAIVERHVETGTERIVYPAPAGRNVGDSSVSPDGRWLAFREGNAPTMIKVMPIAGGEAREIVRVEEPDSIGGFSGINWTPDGQRLLFVRMSERPGTDRTVWTVAASGGPAVKTGLRAKGLRDLHLHADGRRVAFTAGEGADEVWAIDHLLGPSTPKAAMPVSRGR
jgi:Tol biopolymer transport system component